MQLRVRFRQPSLRDALFALLLLGGLVPLVLVNAMPVVAALRDGRLLETGLIIGGCVLLLAALSWILSGWAAAALVEPARRLSEGLGRLTQGELETWVTPTGRVQEMDDLSEAFNQMSALTLKRVRRLERSERDSGTLATDAMRLFRQAVQAKEPLTKHHPGLLEAYSQAVARQLGDHAERFESGEIPMNPFIDPEAEPSAADTRSQPRYEVEDLRVLSPVGAKILDVGAVGMGLETMEKLPLGREDTFELAARTRRLRVPGRVTWCRLVRTIRTASGDMVPVYRAGVRFAESVSPSSRNELLEIIRIHRQVA